VRDRNPSRVPDNPSSGATTTIQLTTEVMRTLQATKIHPRETFSDVLERLLEDVRELDSRTGAEFGAARAEIRSGGFLTPQQVRKATDP
jgi:predicted CopG family antitoxin